MNWLDKPLVRSVDQQETAVILNLYIPDQLHWFRGHFPGHPVLPGVVQIHWVIGYGAQYLHLPTGIKKLEAVKFKQLILPNTALTLQLAHKVNGKLTFSYQHNAQEMSSGRVVYPGSQ